MGERRRRTRGEILEVVVEVVCRELELERDVVLGRRRWTRAVEGRVLVAWELWREGLYVREIAGLMGRTERWVRGMLAGVEERAKVCRGFRVTRNKIEKEVGSKLGEERAERV